MDDSGKDIKGNWRKPSRSSKAKKRRIEEEDRASLEKALRASRESPAPKRKNDNEDLGEDEKIGRFERSPTVSMQSDAVTGLPRSADDDDF